MCALRPPNGRAIRRRPGRRLANGRGDVKDERVKALGSSMAGVAVAAAAALLMKADWAAAHNRTAGERACAYDRAAMLALDKNHFDQDLEGGWRRLDNRGCAAQAADLIRRYRERYGLTDSILYWHEGQLRAGIGQRTRAVRLFERSRRPGPDSFGWNLYVDATLAFLHRDRRALLSARTALARLPRPDGFHPTDVNGNPIRLEWPPNLAVVDGLIACFGKPYKLAYAEACRGAPR